MNPFTKEWLKATLASESIKNLNTITNGYIDEIYNEDKTIHILIVSTDEKVLGIGLNYKELIKSPAYTFKDAIQKVAELLELKTYNVIK